MTCKFCGSSLEDNEVECPYCGHRVANSANTMAANMTSKFARDYDDEDDYSERKKKIQMPKMNRPQNSASSGKSFSVPQSGNSKGSFSFLNFIVSAASALLSLIVLFSLGGIKTQVKDMYQDMLSQFYQQQSNINQLSSQMENIDTNVAGVGQQVSSSQESALIVIDTQPTSVNTTVGRAEYARVFSIQATGNVESITWQKKDVSSGEWVDMVFDFNTSINDEFGLQLYDNHYKGESILYAVGLTEKAEGTYRAKLTDSYNTTKFSDPVTLSFKPAEAGSEEAEA